ncbi:hypothetical protein [Plantactinospora sp. CA-290183]|uniref:hypothetical protein n=1 Tax=Plantactinospora sp. CA-290183 TaxID=3240006 RepID=UPI003D94F894
MASDWWTPAISGIVGFGGLLFGWLTGRQSRQQAEALAEQNNQHALRLAQEATRQALHLEELRVTFAARERHREKLEAFYLEISMLVLQSSELVGDAESGPPPAEPIRLPEEELTRARSTASLYFPRPVAATFDAWYERLTKVHYAMERQAASAREPEQGGGSDAARQAWRRQARDARLREADARNELMTALAEQVRVIVGEFWDGTAESATPRPGPTAPART